MTLSRHEAARIGGRISAIRARERKSIYWPAIVALTQDGPTTPHAVANRYYPEPSVYDVRSVQNTMVRLLKHGDLVRVRYGWYDRADRAEAMPARERVLAVIAESPSTLDEIALRAQVAPRTAQNYVNDWSLAGVPVFKRYAPAHRRSPGNLWLYGVMNEGYKKRGRPPKYPDRVLTFRVSGKKAS